MSVFQVSRTRMRDGWPLGAVTSSPAWKCAWRSQFGALGKSRVGEVRLERHLKVRDRDACTARCGQDRGDVRNDRLDRRDVDTGSLEHAAGGAEVVLHVDD